MTSSRIINNFTSRLSLCNWDPEIASSPIVRIVLLSDGLPGNWIVLRSSSWWWRGPGEASRTELQSGLKSKGISSGVSTGGYWVAGENLTNDSWVELETWQGISPSTGSKSRSAIGRVGTESNNGEQVPLPLSENSMTADDAASSGVLTLQECWGGECIR